MTNKRIEKVNHTFPAFYCDDSEILILGSMPSRKSRELGFYYMHPKNRFWEILSLVFDEEIKDDIVSKKEFLKNNRIALWDVIESCDIVGSSDSSIKNIVVNDINKLLKNTNIKKVYTTGKKAYELYQKYCFKDTMIEAIYLPSTSPTNCSYHLKDLVDSYKKLSQ